MDAVALGLTAGLVLTLFWAASTGPPRTGPLRPVARPAGPPVETAGVRTPVESPGVRSAQDDAAPVPTLLREHPSDRASSIHGRVVAADTGAALEAYRLYVLEDPPGPEAGEPDRSRGILRQDLDGRFRLPLLPAGTYTLVVEAVPTGYERAVVRGVRSPRAEPLVVRVGRAATTEL